MQVNIESTRVRSITTRLFHLRRTIEGALKVLRDRSVDKRRGNHAYP